MDNLLEILASPKQVGILMGAGVSKSCGLLNIEDLTNEIREVIKESNLVKLLEAGDNIEIILSKLSNLKTLVSDEINIEGMSLAEVESLEKDIKKILYNELSKSVDFSKISSLLIWLNFINKEFEKEIFTLNYDLLVEKAMEDLNLPYFTGFIGNVSPFFVSEAVDDTNGIFVKKSWTKLWKLHGSLNFKKTQHGKIFIENTISDDYDKLLIYPSMDKYLSSRKAPFIAYFDRFRKYLVNTEKVLLVLGYSFGDEHVNEIIIDGLNNNARLSVLVFCYDNITYEKCKNTLGLYPNVLIYSQSFKYINRYESSFDCDSNIGDFNCIVKILNNLNIENRNYREGTGE